MASEEGFLGGGGALPLTSAWAGDGEREQRAREAEEEERRKAWRLMAVGWEGTRPVAF